MQQSNHRPRINTVRENPTTFDPVTIAPHASARLPLGRFRDTDPIPQFEIRYEPNLPNIMTHELIRLSLNNGFYVLTGQFQSFHDAELTVIVSRHHNR